MDATEKRSSVPTLKEEGNRLFKVGVLLVRYLQLCVVQIQVK